ncbi:acyltransferase [Enterovibrio sp. 27052020O]|uniref:acyltransferase n=1 Tax=Enterovibrio sp. 27052020O TaxID=3241166 RepID=UPI0038909663
MAWLDNARILAILAVVMLHVAADFVFDAQLGSTLWWIGNVYDSAVRWCVPVFVMISGALLLDPSKTESLQEFYKKRVSRLLVPLVFWTAVYLGWQLVKGVIKNQPESLSTLLLSVLNGTPYYHMWFLYMIVGLYLFTPFFRMVVMQASENALWVLVVAGMSLAAINAGVEKLNGQEAGLFINWFLLYVPYFFLGYLLRQTERYPSFRLIIGVFFAAFVMTALGFYFLAWVSSVKIGLYFYDYLSISVIPMSVSMMFIFKRKSQPLWNPHVTKVLASLTLGVYLIHPMVLEILNFVGVGAMSFSPLISIPIVTFVVYLLALFAAWVMSQLPLFRRCI